MFAYSHFQKAEGILSLLFPCTAILDLPHPPIAIVKVLNRYIVGYRWKVIRIWQDKDLHVALETYYHLLVASLQWNCHNHQVKTVLAIGLRPAYPQLLGCEYFLISRISFNACTANVHALEMSLDMFHR
jgi:hypothetical protein